MLMNKIHKFQHGNDVKLQLSIDVKLRFLTDAKEYLLNKCQKTVLYKCQSLVFFLANVRTQSLLMQKPRQRSKVHRPVSRSWTEMNVSHMREVQLTVSLRELVL